MVKRSPWFVGTTMFALALNIVANWASDPIKDNLGVVGDAVSWGGFRYVAFVALLALWGVLYWWFSPRSSEPPKERVKPEPPPAPKPGVEFFDGRPGLAGTEHMIERELEPLSPLRSLAAGGDEMWAAWYAGTHVSANKLLKRGSPLRRLILANPNDARFLAVLADTFGRSALHLTEDIRDLTRQAQDAGIDVRWHSGVYVGMVIKVTSPHATGALAATAGGKVRLEIPLGSSGRRPSIVLHRDQNPQVVQACIDVFNAMWDSPMTTTPPKQ
jgi:hypothetical protein